MKFLDKWLDTENELIFTIKVAILFAPISGTMAFLGAYIILFSINLYVKLEAGVVLFGALGTGISCFFIGLIAPFLFLLIEGGRK